MSPLEDPRDPICPVCTRHHPSSRASRPSGRRGLSRWWLAVALVGVGWLAVLLAGCSCDARFRASAREIGASADALRLDLVIYREGAAAATTLTTVEARDWRALGALLERHAARVGDHARALEELAR